LFGSPADLPHLDCHAHIAPDVTPAQVRSLNGAHIFAMTRTLEESRAAQSRRDSTLHWGVGVHPGRRDALSGWDPDEFDRQVAKAFVIGEVGLDRAGPADEQERVLRAILERTREAPVLISLHSTGRQEQLLALLAGLPQRGAILHWFTGTAQAVVRAVELDCYFSVNAAMTDEQLLRIPPARMLPETDFPSSKRRTGASKPGGLTSLEQRISRLCGMDIALVRAAWYSNLGALTRQAAVADALPSGLREAIAFGAAWGQ